MTETREQLVQRVREQQMACAVDVDSIQGELMATAARLLPAIGEITPTELLEQLRAVTMKAFARRLEAYL